MVITKLDADSRQTRLWTPALGFTSLAILGKSTSGLRTLVRKQQHLTQAGSEAESRFGTSASCLAARDHLAAARSVRLRTREALRIGCCDTVLFVSLKSD